MPLIQKIFFNPHVRICLLSLKREREKESGEKKRKTSV